MRILEGLVVKFILRLLSTLN